MADEDGIGGGRDVEGRGGRTGPPLDPLPRAGGEEGAGVGALDEGAVRLVPGRHRAAQAVRSGGRKLFKGALRQEFLEWLAATANVKWSADRAGVAYQTVWKHRMNDPPFAADFDRALEQGVARVRAKLLETRAEAQPTPIDGDYDAPELQAVDPQVAMAVLREHGQGLSGPSPMGRPKKAGRTPHAASNAEVEAALAKRLKAYAARVRGRGQLLVTVPGEKS